MVARKRDPPEAQKFVNALYRMPKALKKRGRRAEKESREAEGEARPAKRRRTDGHEDFAVNGEAGDDFISFGHDPGFDNEADQGTTFYGLLTEEEQEYYSNINKKIVANDFEDDADRTNFIEAIYRETNGKEIKVASSQSCSRYLEKLIHLSTPVQLRSLFEAFLQDLDYLVQHRFGSHCVEALFVQSTRYIDSNKREESDNARSFESLFLEATQKLEANAGFLLTERFASHTIRILLLILSGQPLEDESAKEIVASRKKEKSHIAPSTDIILSEPRKVPKSFQQARTALVQSAVAGLDTNYLRALATSPTGSPVLQLLIRLELVDSDSESAKVLDKLIPDQDFQPESESGKWVSSLIYDASGAYLVQTLVKHLPGKVFKKMYKNLFKDRIGKIAKNEIASYVAISVFERVGKDDLEHAVTAMLPEVAGLVERNRLAVIRSLIERSAVRGVDLTGLKETLCEVYGVRNDLVLPKMLKLDLKDKIEESIPHGKDLKPDLQGALLAQTILRTAELSCMIHNSLKALDNTILVKLSCNAISSRIIQLALTAEQTPNTLKRQLVPRLYDSVSELAIDASGSHVVDALWIATNGSHFMKEKIADILRKHEPKLRESNYGRNVWRNWFMDSYTRRRGEWQAIAKGRVTDQSTTQTEASSTKPQKSAIELARERHMKQKQKTQAAFSSSSTVRASA